MAPPLSIEHLRKRLQSLPSTEAVRFAADLLGETDLRTKQPSVAVRSAAQFLRTYSARLKMKLEGVTGLVEVGLADLVRGMTELPPNTLLGITGFETREWMLWFWSDEADQVVWPLAVKKRTAEEEAERLREFTNLTQ